MDARTLIELQREAQQVYASSALLDYVQAIVNHTRRSPAYASGLSPRAALALLHASRAWALMDGRRYVVPEDVQAVLPGVVGHRLAPIAEVSRANGADVAEQLIRQVPIP
jgi:MoxR-like ATPase